MGLTTKAALALAPKSPLQLETVDLADPAEDEVLVEIKATGLCHSDLGFIDGHARHRFPAIFGHEGAGVVVACGKAVRNVAPGDHVIPFSVPHCGVCRFCRSGRTNFCVEVPKTLGGTVSRFSFHGEPVANFSGLGTFAQFLVAKAHQVVPVRRDLPFDHACYIACGGATGLGAVLYTAKVERGASVAVFGLGGVGLNAVQGARLAGAAMIVGVDLNPARGAVGRELGLTHYIDPREVDDVAAWIRKESDGGVDYAFECVGAHDLVRAAMDSTNTAWGKTVIVGAVPAGHLHVGAHELIMGRAITGTLLGSVIGPQQIPLIADWVANGEVDFSSLITDRIPLAAINDGLQALREGRGIRTVVTFDD